MFLQMILYVNIWVIYCYSWCVYLNVCQSRHVAYVTTDDSLVETFVAYVATDDYMYQHVNHMLLWMIICSNIWVICCYSRSLYRNIRPSRQVAYVATNYSFVTTCGICRYHWSYVARFVAYVPTVDAYIATFICHDMWHMVLQMIRLS